MKLVSVLFTRIMILIMKLVSVLFTRIFTSQGHFATAGALCNNQISYLISTAVLPTDFDWQCSPPFVGESSPLWKDSPLSIHSERNNAISSINSLIRSQLALNKVICRPQIPSVYCCSQLDCLKVATKLSKQSGQFLDSKSCAFDGAQTW